jgi:hypothetical protein
MRGAEAIFGHTWGPSAARAGRRKLRAGILVLSACAIVAALAGFAYFWYVRGERSARTVTTHTGVVYASTAQATVRAGGSYYDIPLNVPWYDSDDVLHIGGRPSCLRVYKLTSIVFGTVSFYVDGALNRMVVWVRC